MLRVIKKLISLLASSVAVLIVSGFLSLQPIASKRVYAVGPVCADITHSAGHVLTDAVPGQAGVAESGQLDFNYGAPDAAYQACIEQTENTAPTLAGSNSVPGYFTKGWVWNTNLGLVSMSCENGLNQGSPCGGINYAAEVKENVGADADVLGYAYGDAMGWIRLSCINGSNNGIPCGAVSYGVKMATSAGVHGACVVQPGDMYGYAWTDSVGWISMCGAHGVIPSIDPDVPTVPLVTVTKSNGGPLIYANNDDAYIITVHLQRNGIDVDIPGATVTAIDITNTVKRDQVSPCDINEAACKAVDNPIFGKVGMTYVAQVRSFAPTNEDNVLVIPTLQIEIPNAPVINYAMGAQSAFAFESPITVEISAEGQQAGILSVLPNQDQQMNFTVSAWNGGGVPPENSTVYGQIYDCTADYDFMFDENGDLTGTQGAPEQNGFPYQQKAGLCENQALGDTFTFPDLGGGAISIFGQSVEGVQNPQMGNNPVVLQSIVELPTLYSTPTRYFSGALTNSSVTNQAASIQGNVSIDIIDTNGLSASDQISASIGERAQKQRERYSRAIESITRSKEPLTINNNQVQIGRDELITGGVLYYKAPRNIFGLAPNTPCSIYVRNASDLPTDELAPTKNTTIVAVGCNVYIDENIRGGDGKLGIIALEDFSIRGTNRGGNAYICSEVTDVEANFVLDKSLLSYAASDASCGKNNLDADGFPLMGNNFRNTLRNQLAIVGSLVSENTYGGSLGRVGTATPPRLGDGSIVTNQQDLQKAQLYDINFMRFAHTEEMDGVGSCWSHTTRLSKEITGDAYDINDWENICIDEVNTPRNKSIVNITYRAPAPNQPVFNEAK